MGLSYENENGEWVKQCAKCKITFGDIENNFHKHRAQKDGFATRCKKCNNSHIASKEAICAWEPCGNTFISRSHQRNRKWSRFCSFRCSSLAMNHTMTWRRNCRKCSKRFVANRPGLVYCSDECLRDAELENRIKRDTPKNQVKRNTRNYDITPEDYEKMLEEQGELCAICGRKETATRNGKVKRLSIDHDHRTRRVRGLLCQSCNTAIGLFKDNLIIILHAARYIEQNITHPEQLLHTHDAIFGDKADYWRTVFPNFSE
jgi:hypothetical protein